MSATTDDSLGLIVTATFAGNIERYLGQGDLRRGLVALVLVPRSGRATPGGLADQGGGYMAPRLPLLARSGRHTAVLARTLGVFSPEQVLHVGTPPQAGAVRSGNQIVFYVRRAGLSQVTNFVTYATNSSNIETVSSGLDDVAFLNPDGSKVLVAYNNSSASVTFGVSSSGSYFTYTIPPQAMTTFVWQ